MYFSSRTFRVEFNTPDTVAEFRDMFAEGKVNIVINISLSFNATFSECYYQCANFVFDMS